MSENKNVVVIERESYANRLNFDEQRTVESSKYTRKILMLPALLLKILFLLFNIAQLFVFSLLEIVIKAANGVSQYIERRD